MPAAVDRPPPWARAVDICCLVLILFAAVVAVSDGFRFRIAGLRVVITSPYRLLFLSVVLGLVRYAAAPAVPIHRDLPRRVAAWRQRFLSFELDGAEFSSLPALQRGRRFPWLCVQLVVLFTALTAVMTYPQVRHLDDAVYDPGDPLLNLWALSWIAHQLPRAPARIFDANIFAPERHTLAYSETLLAPGILAAPLHWLGIGGILVYNIALLSGFIVSGVGTTLLVRELTRNTGAAIVAGISFAFLPFRFDHMAQLQLQQSGWIPLALWALHRVIWNGRLRDGLWLGVSAAGQLLSCMYYGVYLAGYLLVAGGSLIAGKPQVARARLPVMAAGAALAIVLFLPAGCAYLGARAVVGERGAHEIHAFSATWENYLAAPEPNWLYGWSAERFGGLERQLFPGLLVLVLAAASLRPPWPAPQLAYLIGLVFAVDLTLGFNGVTYAFLYEHAPPFRALRIPALAVVLVGFSLAVLAGYGAARVLRRLNTRRAQVVFVGAVSAGVLLESCSIPVPLTAIPSGPPGIYADLVRDNGSSPPATIVDLPIILGPDARYNDQIYMYYSTFHWQNLLNGYSGFFPRSYFELVDFMRGFPDARSLEGLRTRGARYVVIHGERLSQEEYERVIRAIDDCRCGITQVSQRLWRDQEQRLYRLPQ